jgi:alpha-glucoside transport system substrate-binding protein
MIWYNVERYKALGSPTFESFDEIIEFTNLNSTKDNELWCLSIDSAENQPLLDYEYGESAGWIVSNWLENIVLANYGTNIYDNWVKNDIKFSDDEITLSLLDIGKIVHSDGNVYRGKEYLIRSQVSTSAANLLDEDSSCVFSLMGHHAINYFPQSKKFVEDYDFLYFPSQDYSNMVVGIGDTVSLLNYDAPSLEVYAELISASFGQIWASKIDSQYVSARTDFDKNKYSNEFTKKEYIQIKDSLSMNLFRYDGSMLMEKGTGQKILWTTLRQFVTQSNDYLEQVTEEIDTRIKRELLGN